MSVDMLCHTSRFSVAVLLLPTVIIDGSCGYSALSVLMSLL